MQTALIIEDDGFFHEIYASALKTLGFSRVRFATDGVSAERFLDTNDSLPELILLDLFMPNKDGIEVIDHLDSVNYKGKLILVTAASGNVLEIARMLAKKKGLDLRAALPKPFTLTDLSHALSDETGDCTFPQPPSFRPCAQIYAA